jgi:hypothetical protein
VVIIEGPAETLSHIQLMAIDPPSEHHQQQVKRLKQRGLAAEYIGSRAIVAHHAIGRLSGGADGGRYLLEVREKYCDKHTLAALGASYRGPACGGRHVQCVGQNG